MTKTLAPLELSLYEGAGALALTHGYLNTLSPVWRQDIANELVNREKSWFRCAKRPNTRDTFASNITAGGNNITCSRKSLQAICQEIVRSATKVASESKILARSNHLEQYFINSQISSKFQILSEFQQKYTFPSLRSHDKNLDLARTFAVKATGL